jgi:hypothetical protein
VQRRHRDPGDGRCSFTDDVLVVCPRCAGCAHLFAPPSCIGPTARLVCTNCGHATARHRHADVCRYTAVEPRVELWLRIPCAGRVLWAFNPAHIAALDSHIGARLREDAAQPGLNMTMLARLPSWMTAAKHRTEVLRGLSRLRERVPVHLR